MVSEREIGPTAREVISQHGEAAAPYALHRAEELDAIGAFEAAKTWRRILAEIRRLQVMEPEGGVN